MKNVLLGFFLFLGISAFGQHSFDEVQITTQNFDSFFENKQQSDYYVLFVVPNADSFSITNGEEMGINMRQGSKLVVFVSSSSPLAGVFSLSASNGSTVVLGSGNSFGLTEVSSLNFHQDEKLIFNYDF